MFFVYQLRNVLDSVSGICLSHTKTKFSCWHTSIFIPASPQTDVLILIYCALKTAPNMKLMSTIHTDSLFFPFSFLANNRYRIASHRILKHTHQTHTLTLNATFGLIIQFFPLYALYIKTTSYWHRFSHAQICIKQFEWETAQCNSALGLFMQWYDILMEWFDLWVYQNKRRKSIKFQPESNKINNSIVYNDIDDMTNVARGKNVQCSCKNFVLNIPK